MPCDILPARLLLGIFHATKLMPPQYFVASFFAARVELSKLGEKFAHDARHICAPAEDMKSRRNVLVASATH